MLRTTRVAGVAVVMAGLVAAGAVLVGAGARIFFSCGVKTAPRLRERFKAAL